MTDDEWTHLDTLLENWWGQPWSETKSRAYRLALSEFPAADVARVLEAALDAGGDFRPSAAKLRAHLRGVGPTHPDPDTAWDLIVKAINRVGCSIYDSSFAQRHQAAVDWLAGQDRVLAAFAARRGLCGPGSLGDAPVNDPDRGGVSLATVKRDYREAVEFADQREAAGRLAVHDRDLLVRDTGTGEGFAEVLRRYAGNAGELEAGNG